jgi:hypothetical protein
MTANPARVKMFIPKRMSLVSIALGTCRSSQILSEIECRYGSPLAQVPSGDLDIPVLGPKVGEHSITQKAGSNDPDPLFREWGQ